MPGVTLRPARSDEAAALTELALRSKAHWGYSAEFIEACRDELTVQPEDIERDHVLVAEIDGVVVGTATVGGEPPTGEVENCFVEPEHIGQGIGGVLFAQLRADAIAAGFDRLRIDADPNAVGFYERQGAVKVGESPSGSIPGRVLPQLELKLTDDS